LRAGNNPHCLGPVFGKKRKGIYIEQSEFSFLVARTSSPQPPFTIEAMGELPLDSGATGAALFGGLADFGSNPYLQAICGVHPPKRFIVLHELESMAKVKDPQHFEEVLKTKHKIDPSVYDIDIFLADSGERYDFSSTGHKRFIFCGAPRESFSSIQSSLLEKGVYPTRLELSTLSTIGAVLHYAETCLVKEPILFLELGIHGAVLFILHEGKLEDAIKIQRGIESIFPHLQEELSLKDASSAQRLFFSNTFDFTELGPKLLAEVIREVQALTGSYEVRTGQLVEHCFVSLLPRNLAWIGQTLATSLGLQPLQMNYLNWLRMLDIEVDDGVDLTNRGPRWMGLFGLMAQYAARADIGQPEKNNETTDQQEEIADSPTVAN
jgi:hypothetical protein